MTQVIEHLLSKCEYVKIVFNPQYCKEICKAGLWSGEGDLRVAVERYFLLWFMWPFLSEDLLT
jgi:hypothetical protein